MATKEFHSVETQYSGTHFRSRLEARWAVFFDALGIKWHYELSLHQLLNGQYYLPDFRIREPDLYLEVKGDCPSHEALLLCRMLAMDSGDVCIFQGLPGLNVGVLFVGLRAYSRWPGFPGDAYPISILECLSKSEKDIKLASRKAASAFLPPARRKSKAEWFREWQHKKAVLEGAYD